MISKFISSPKYSEIGDFSWKSQEVAARLTIFLLVFFACAAGFGWLNQLMARDIWSRHWAFPISLAVAFLVLCMRGGWERSALWCYLIFAGILTMLLALSGLFLDQSWDGLAYHQRAVIALLNGADFLTELQPTQNLWVNAYPKATWYYAATLVSWFGLSSLGASYQFILSVAAGAYLYRFCRWSGRGVGLASVVAALWMLNPVAICQWFTYYNDAAVGSLGLMLFLSAILMVRGGEKLDRAIFLLCAVLIVNIKTSGFILAGTAFIYVFFENYSITRQIRTTTKRVAKLFFLFVVAGVCVLGYSPYMQNITHDRHIFYPLAGKNQVDIITCCAPYGFPENGRLRNLFMSIFSRSVNAHPGMGEDAVRLKIPGSVASSERYTFREPDTRVGGFGPLFSLMLVLGILVLPLLRIDWSIAAPLFIMIALSTGLHPHAWWARYVPIIWLVPLISIIAAKQLCKRSTGAGVVALIIVAATFNSALIIQPWVTHHPRLDAEIKREAKILSGKNVKIYSEEFSPELELRELGMNYEIVSRDYYISHREKFKKLARDIQYAID